MNDSAVRAPAALERLTDDTQRLGFTLASEPRTGAVLRVLAASKPGGRLLELGTGTGVGTAWLLDGMDRDARLLSIDTEAPVQAVARRHLGDDPRVTFQLGHGGAFLEQASAQTFDLIYADAWPGKFTHLDEALSLLTIGGMYLVDDLLPQPNWPVEHAPRVPVLIDRLRNRPGFVEVTLAWSSGLMLLVRVGS
ncbi:MAG: class I SAM-dependent methyltransferase [Acidobacteriota bacterium]